MNTIKLEELEKFIMEHLEDDQLDVAGQTIERTFVEFSFNEWLRWKREHTR